MLWFVQMTPVKVVLKILICGWYFVCFEKGKHQNNQSTFPCLELIYLLLWGWELREGDGIFPLFALFLLFFLSLNPPIKPVARILVTWLHPASQDPSACIRQDLFLISTRGERDLLFWYGGFPFSHEISMKKTELPLVFFQRNLQRSGSPKGF